LWAENTLSPLLKDLSFLPQENSEEAKQHVQQFIPFS
jgi:hypothetical protein